MKRINKVQDIQFNAYTPEVYGLIRRFLVPEMAPICELVVATTKLDGLIRRSLWINKKISCLRNCSHLWIENTAARSSLGLMTDPSPPDSSTARGEMEIRVLLDQEDLIIDY